jgi:tetratricopeptide (TPR) repeat protein
VRSEPSRPAGGASRPEDLRRRFERGESELFVPLAGLARREGRSQEAQQLVEAGLARWPQRVSAWVELARLKAQLGRMDEALGHYREVLERLDARNLPALRALAAAALAAGDDERARRYLAGWALEDPLDPELEDLREELAALSQEAPAPIAAEAAPSAGLLELSLADLEPGYLPAPSPGDAGAWSAAAAGRKGR